MDKTEFEVVLYKAFIFGQIYWKQADSENPRDWTKSDITREEFKSFVSEMVKKFENVV